MTDRIKALEDALRKLLARDQLNTCQHENTHRGGANWEICEDCGAKWADDRGGKPTWADPPEWVAARAHLAASQPAPDCHQPDLVTADGGQSAQPVAVKVKPLAWEQAEYYGAVVATARAFYDAGYKITSWSGFDYVEVTVAAPGYQKTGYVGEGIYPDFDAAKAAAQADYEARIMAALDVLPLTVQDAAMVLLEAMKGGLDPLDACDPAIEALAVKHAGNRGDGVIQLEIAEEFFTAALRAIAEGRA